MRCALYRVQNKEQLRAAISRLQRSREQAAQAGDTARVRQIDARLKPLYAEAYDRKVDVGIKLAKGLERK